MNENENKINGEENTSEDIGFSVPTDDVESTSEESEAHEAVEHDEPSVEEPTEEDYIEESYEDEENDEDDEAVPSGYVFSVDSVHNTKVKNGSNALTSIAIVLSLASVLLLIGLCCALMLGLFPTTGRDVIIQSSDSTPPLAEGDADPNLIEDFMNSVVVISATTRTSSSTGTGIVISENGYIVTNYHVIEGASSIKAYFYSEQSTPVTATLVGHSEIDDIAVLKVAKTGLRAATFAKSVNCRVGERVYAIGTPEGADFGWSVTQGIISSKDREIKIYDDEGILEKKMRVIQTDASVNPGNSGGPLINTNGHVVGIITLKLSDSAGMGFAIPSDGANEIIQAIIKYGNADSVNSAVTSGRPLMGITGVGVQGETWYTNVQQGTNTAIQAVTEDYAKQYPEICFYAPIDGVYVSAITEGLDAANHLKIGDVITDINGKSVGDIYDVMDIINALNGGDKITVKYYRDGNYGTEEITLGTQK